MTGYVRPPMPRLTFVGPDGTEFEYGDRWDMAGPPEDTYSVDSHPERFAPLHGVADALVAHLVATYDVEVDEGDDVQADFLWPRPQRWRVLRAVRLRPVDPAGAPLSIVWETYPGVCVHAGELCDAFVPQCGCDACDETAESGAGALEDLVLAVATGGFAESVDVRRRIVEHTQTRRDGWSRSSGVVGDHVTRARLSAAAARLRALPDGWQPWPVRRPLPQAARRD